MKVIIAGSRDFNDYKMLKAWCDFYFNHIDVVEIVSGTANGADTLGEKYAQERGWNIARFPAKWDEFGKRAGHIRNKEMADYADGLIAFWNGQSKGTKNMIDLAMKNRLKVRIVNTK